MSKWQEITDSEDVSLSADGKTIDVYIGSDDEGSIYIEIPIEFIKEKLK